MATKANFTPDEWKSLLQSPLLVGIAVSAADPSGLIGMLKESMASARALVQAKADPNADELVKSVAGDFETSEGRGLAQDGLKALLAGSKPADISAKAVDALRALSALLAAKAPADAARLQDLALPRRKRGRGSGAGGRISGLRRRDQVSEAEKAGVAQIAVALGVSVAAGT